MDIKEIREKFGLSQAKLSFITGIPKRTIENWEGGSQGNSRTPPNYMPDLVLAKVERFFQEQNRSNDMADFNLGKAKSELRDYVNGVMGEYYRYFIKNGIDPLNIQNEQLEKNVSELNQMSGLPIALCKNEDEVKQLKNRVDELRKVIK